VCVCNLCVYVCARVCVCMCVCALISENISERFVFTPIHVGERCRRSLKNKRREVSERGSVADDMMIKEK
jgi:hypothetical protein